MQRNPNVDRRILERRRRIQSMSYKNRKISRKKKKKKKKLYDEVAKFYKFGQMMGISMGWSCSTCMERRNTSEFLALMPVAN